MLCKGFVVSQLAIPVVSVLISFLAYTSQYFFFHFRQAPLQKDEVWRINILATCIWICYYRACTVDPGHIPKDWKPTDGKHPEQEDIGQQRWCRRCEARKPPRAHHCKSCGRSVKTGCELWEASEVNGCVRCIPKMDHHCPWTSNCVSHFTFPHFIRFLFYTVVGTGYLGSLLFQRASIVWGERDLASVGFHSTAVAVLVWMQLLITNST